MPLIHLGRGYSRQNGYMLVERHMKNLPGNKHLPLCSLQMMVKKKHVSMSNITGQADLRLCDSISQTLHGTIYIHLP